MKRIGICGYGYVGQAVDIMFRKSENDIVIFDIKKNYNSYKPDLLNTDFIFVCLPTPFDEIKNEINSEVITEFLDYLDQNSYKGIVVIKSTILYNKIMTYEKKLKIVVNPEFLNENDFLEDAYEQKVVLLGGEAIYVHEVMMLYAEMDNDLEFRLTTAEIAMNFKYIRNIYGAYKVLFWEFVQDTTGNARKMAELFKDFPYQGEMAQVGMDGYRGYGGSCFPKDVKAFNSRNAHLLTNFMVQYNKNLQEIY